jgi:hypothetical protein
MIMQRLKTLGVALVAAFAVSGLASASASAAAPNFTGPFPDAFTITGHLTFAASSGTSVLCLGGTGTGSITAEKTGTFKLEFSSKTKTNCVHSTSGAECKVGSGPVAMEGTVELVQIKPGVVALVLAPKEVELTCGSETVKLRHSAIGLVTPLNRETTQYTVTFEEEGGKQKYRECEIGTPCGAGKTIQLEASLNGGAFEAGYVSGPLTLTAAKETQIVGAEPEQPEFETLNSTFKGVFKEVAITSKFASARWTYSWGTISGEMASHKTLKNVTLTLGEGGNNGWVCNNEGSNLTLKGLRGRLGWINKGKESVGVLFEPVSQPLAKCSSKDLGNQEYRGDIIAHLGPVNKAATSFELNFETNGGSSEEPLNFEGETEALPLTLGGEAASLAASGTIEFPKTTKIVW